MVLLLPSTIKLVKTLHLFEIFILTHGIYFSVTEPCLALFHWLIKISLQSALLKWDFGQIASQSPIGGKQLSIAEH